MTTTRVDASTARTMFPFVKGPINGADLWSGFAILDMGVGAHGVVVGGKFVACSPDYTSAKINGEHAANLAAGVVSMPKAVVAYALKHNIRLGAQRAALYAGFDYYYIVNAKGTQCEMTRSHRPTAKQALAMCKRYVNNRDYFEGLK